MNVGSAREFATSDKRANFGVVEIGVYLRKFCARGPTNIGPVIGEFTPKKIPILRWDLALPVLAVL